MKYFLWVLVIGVVGYLGWNAIQTKPDASVPSAVVEDTSGATGDVGSLVGGTVLAGTGVDNASVKIAFKGFGPGKIHNGTIEKVISNLSFGADDSLTGTVEAHLTTLVSDAEKLTDHLKSKDFFEVEKYPTAKFKLLSIIGIDAQGGVISGDMTIKGITKKVELPFSFSNNVYTSKFNINMKDFGINQTFANETIELTVTVPLK